MDDWFYILCYLAGVNVLAFVLFGADKWKAKRHRFRFPEDVLMLSAAAGGSIGAILGMKLFHHKTRHNKFRFGLPLILLVQTVLAAAVLFFM